MLGEGFHYPFLPNHIFFKFTSITSISSWINLNEKTFCDCADTTVKHFVSASWCNPNWVFAGEKSGMDLGKIKQQGRKQWEDLKSEPVFRFWSVVQGAHACLRLQLNELQVCLWNKRCPCACVATSGGIPLQVGISRQQQLPVVLYKLPQALTAQQKPQWDLPESSVDLVMALSSSNHLYFWTCYMAP